MQIELTIGEKVVVLRGNEDGTVDLCHWVPIRNKEGEMIDTPIPYKYFASIQSALQRVYEMRVCIRDATTLEKLLEHIKEEREWLRKELGVGK